MEEAELLLLHSLMKNETVGSPIPTSLMGLENIQVNGAQQSGLIPTSLRGLENIQVNGAQQSGLIPTSLMGLENIEVNGFVFSTSKVLAQLNRKLALAAARSYKENGWDPKKNFPPRPVTVRGILFSLYVSTTCMIFNRILQLPHSNLQA